MSAFLAAHAFDFYCLFPFCLFVCVSSLGQFFLFFSIFFCTWACAQRLGLV
eukprot:m.171864 g.171864  ORF g.171864 m.171864 type:complete len:51 (+) comp15292_c1_seq2:1737-1889(+)